MRRPPTRGGPKPPSPTPVELEMLNSTKDSHTLCGQSSGYDTEEGIHVTLELAGQFEF